MGEKRPVSKPRKRAGAGYMRSRFNATKHGLAAEHSVLPGEDPEAYRTLKERYYGEWQPPGPTAESLVDELVDIDWRLRRYKKVELAEFRDQMLEMLSQAIPQSDHGTIKGVGVNPLVAAHKAALLESYDSLLEQVFGEPMGYIDANVYAALKTMLLILVEEVPREEGNLKHVISKLPPKLHELWRLSLEDKPLFEAFLREEGLRVVAIKDETWASFERFIHHVVAPYLDILQRHHPMAMVAHKHMINRANREAMEKLDSIARYEERLHARRVKVVGMLIALRSEDRSAA